MLLCKPRWGKASPSRGSGQPPRGAEGGSPSRSLPGWPAVPFQKTPAHPRKPFWVSMAPWSDSTRPEGWGPRGTADCSLPHGRKPAGPDGLPGTEEGHLRSSSYAEGTPTSAP